METSSIRQHSFDTQPALPVAIRLCQGPCRYEMSASTENSIPLKNVSAYISSGSDCTAQGSSIGCDTDSCYSVSECGTPQEIELVCLSDSPTPIGNDPGPIDSAQIMLRLFLQAARSGQEGLPEWDGLAEALRVYFAEGWQKDKFTKEEAERKKEFLFWNAVSEEKWRVTGDGCQMPFH